MNQDNNMEPISIDHEIEQNLAHAQSMMQKQSRRKLIFIGLFIFLVVGLAATGWWFSPYLPPAKVNAALDGVRVTSLDRFDNPTTDKWGFDAGEIANGVLLVQGTGWRGLSYTKKFTEGEGIIVDFVYDQSAHFNAGFNRGAWAQSSYRSFGFYGNAKKSYPDRTTYEADAELADTPISGDLKLTPGTEYSLLMAVLPNGEFLLVIWDPANPDLDIQYHLTKRNSSWTELSWTFAIGINSGQVKFDNFREITFTQAK